MKASCRRALLALTAVVLASPLATAAEDAPKSASHERQPPPKIAWVKGPARVDLGKNIAALDLDEQFLFARQEDARKLLEYWGNQVDENEVGLLVPRADDQDWAMIFTWHDVGYVKDDDKDKIDADAILKSIQEGTDEGNAFRKERGIPALHVLGWLEPPRYDERRHNLVWATRARNDANRDSTNYNVRVLGREGYLSVTLVDEPRKLAQSKPAVENVLAHLNFKSGKSYAEWVPGDKVAKYGLTALVAAGAGAAAVKLGLIGILGKVLAKFAKVIVAGVVAIGAGLAKLWNAARGRRSTPKRPTDPAA